jgi:integrase
MSVRKRSWVTVAGESREVWAVAYTDQAGVRRLKHFARRRDADVYESEVKTQVRAGTHTASSVSPTITEAAADWIKSVELEGREATTVTQYRQHAHHIIDRIGSAKLANLTTPALNKFRDELLATMSRAMARKVMSSLKSLLKDAQRRGSVAQNAALAVKRIDADKRGEDQLRIGVHIPALEEIKALLTTAGPHAKPLLMVATFTGLRSSELRGLRWSDVDLKNSELHVRQRADRYGVIGKPKSKAGYRTVPFGPLVLKALQEWKLAGPKGRFGLVFPTPSGDGVALHNNVVRAFTTAARAAGLTDANGKAKYTGLHSLRHFFASWLINPPERGGQGLAPKVVQQLLGHSSILMTMDTYGHLFPPDKDAHKKLADAERAVLVNAIRKAP